MEPIPETRAIVEALSMRFDADLLAQLVQVADQVRAVVPECVGLSLAAFAEGHSFTLVATQAEIAMFDAAQYLDDGPCVTAAETGHVESFERGNPLDEAAWQLFADSNAARGVASTLTLPVLEHQHEGSAVIGTVNLYAATARAFDGHHEELAAVFAAWAPGAVRNADLGFTTRAAAEEAGSVKTAEDAVGRAATMLAQRDGVEVAEARRRIRDAAMRAGVTEAGFASLLTETLDEDDEGHTG